MTSDTFKQTILPLQSHMQLLAERMLGSEAEAEDVETVAELADGVRKITLPEEFSYFRIFKELANDDKAGLYKQQSASQLGGLYLARMVLSCSDGETRQVTTKCIVR